MLCVFLVVCVLVVCDVVVILRVGIVGVVGDSCDGVVMFKFKCVR